MVAKAHGHGHVDAPSGPDGYKRDKKGQFAKVNTLVKKIALAKAQGVKHVEPGPAKKPPPAWAAIKGTNAKADGLKLYERKKAGEFVDDNQIYAAAAKLAAAYKKNHPNDKNAATANQIVNAYKRHEYDETGQVMLMGKVDGKVDPNGPGAASVSAPKPPSKPTIDTTKSGISISSSKFDKPDTLKPTGKTLGGVTGAKVYVDGKSQEWLVKAPKSGSNAYSNGNYLVDIEVAASRIQNKAGLSVPAMHAEEVDGKMSAVSKMYKSPDGGPVKEAYPKGVGLDISKMTAEDILSIQKNQVLDWLLSNHDSHSANFLRTSEGIVGIDKGQSFKFFGKDKLDYNYEPVMPLDGNVSVYQRIWKQFASGKGALFDPSEGELKGTIQRIQSIPDAEYRKLLTPYAIKAAASGSLSAPGSNKSEKVDNFLNAAVERKNNLQKDFDAYYAKVKAEHDANKPKGPVASKQKRKAIGDPVYPSDLAIGLGFAMKKSDGTVGPTSKITNIIGDNVYLGTTIDVPTNFFKSGNFVITELPPKEPVASSKAKAAARTPYDKLQKGILSVEEYEAEMGVWASNGYINPTSLEDKSKFKPQVGHFVDLSEGDFIRDTTDNGTQYYKITGFSDDGNAAYLADAKDNDSQLDPITKGEWNAGGNDFMIMKPVSSFDQKLTGADKPELNKPLKEIGGLKIGDKIQAPWGSVFTVTGVGGDGNGKYVETASANGGFGGNIYDTTIAEVGPDNPFVYVGNINDQGSVDAGLVKDQDGTPKPKPLTGLHEVAPGDVVVDDQGYKYVIHDVSSAIFADGYVTMKMKGGSIEWKMYASDVGDYTLERAVTYPTYPASDIQVGPFTTKNAPGTTLGTLSLPGWGGYKGDLTVGDEIVAYGANGEFKKGSVVQSAGAPMNVYISWDDDPQGDWAEFTKGGVGGFWGDGSVSGVDEWTLVGKVQSAAASTNPAPQKPVGPSSAPAAAATPTVPTPNAGKPATFDALVVGSVYHVPGGKMQKVISKDADSFTAQSVSGNQHTYPKEKFNTWAASKGVLLGIPGQDDPAPPIAEAANDEVYILPTDPFAPNVPQEKYIVKSKSANEVEFANIATGQMLKVKKSEWDEKTKGWKRVPGMSEWEKYSQGLITWEEYEQTTSHKDVASLHKKRLHTPEGPAAPGKQSPAEAFAAKKAITEKKPPPPWSSIKGAHVKEMGAEVYALKKSGELTTDKELYLACGKVIRAWKKKYPSETNWPTNNQLRHAARRLEYEENGVVVWETEAQKTAPTVANVQTAKSAVHHVPTGKYGSVHNSSKVPLTTFGDSKKLVGSYQNPINFGVSYSVTPGMALWGNASNPQGGSHFTSGETSAIGWYTGSGAKDAINPYLRSGTVGYGNTTKIQTAVENIDSAMAKSNPVEDWTIVTRGAYGGYDVGIGHGSATLDEVRAQIGKTVLNKGYSSTSLGSRPAFGGSYRVIYRVPPGLKGLWVSGSGSGQKLSSCGYDEREFILPRNLKLKVLAAQEHTDGFGYKFDVIVEIVGWEGQGK